MKGYVSTKNRLVKDEDSLFCFTKVTDERLPFHNNFFDIVISNHVIEHVDNAQRHLAEISRVLCTRGVLYFATPNRNFPREVHTNTIFLHFFPYKIFWTLLKYLNKYQEPIKLLSYGKMKQIFSKTGFLYEDYTMKIVNNPTNYYMEEQLKFRLPGFMSWIAPTNVFVLTKQDIATLYKGQ